MFRHSGSHRDLELVMAYMIAVSACFRCRKMFSYNPELVLNVTITSEDTSDESMWGTGPLCEPCVKDINEFRVTVLHLPPWEYHPNSYKSMEVEG